MLLCRATAGRILYVRSSARFQPGTLLSKIVMPSGSSTRSWAKICPIFGTVSTGYTPLQNRDAFRFFDPIVGEGAAIYHTAGALGDGERVWMLAKLPDDIQVAVGDISNKYLLLSNSHDGRSSVQIKFTPVRVVCNNTLVQALGSGETIRVSHTSDLRNRLDIARQNLRLINTRYTSIESTFRDMVRVKMDDTRLAAYLKLVFPEPHDPKDERAAQAQGGRRLVRQPEAFGGRSSLLAGPG